MDADLTEEQKRLVREACDCMDQFIFSKYESWGEIYNDTFIINLLAERARRNYPLR